MSIRQTNSFSFRLEKHYLDFVDDSGRCFIIYSAEISYLFLKVYYSEIISSEVPGGSSHHISLKRSLNPEPSSEIHIDHAALHLSGTWIQKDKPLPVLKFIDSSGKEISWDCHHPGTITAIKFRDLEYRGFGYAETLTTTIKPQKLPINKIIWGRFHADGQTIVWICWKGSNPLNKLYFNGEEFTDARYEEDRITFNKARYSLIFLRAEILRRGELSSLFKDMKWIKIFFGKGVMNSVENKFKSRTRLELDNTLISTGWSLYEYVIWKSTKDQQ